MKKFCFSLVLLGFAVSSLTACGKKEQAVVPEVNTENVEIVDSNDSDKEEYIVDGRVEFTQDKFLALRQYLQRAKYIEVSQTMTNESASGEVFAKTVYNIKSNADSKVTLSTITTSKDGEESEKLLADDEKHDYHFTKNQGDSSWHEDDGTTLSVSWDMKKMSNAWDMYEYILNGYDIEEGTVGRHEESYDYFEVTKPADEASLVGIEYDELGDQTITYVFENMNDDYIPLSVVVKVDFTLSGVKYSCTSAIQFINISNETLEMPSELNLSTETDASSEEDAKTTTSEEDSTEEKKTTEEEESTEKSESSDKNEKNEDEGE